VCYLLPQYVLDGILYAGGSMPFYEYYFEPTGTHTLIFFQFMHRDFEKGMEVKRVVERTMLAANVLVVVLFFCGVLMYARFKSATLLIVSLLIFATAFFNSLEIISKMVKNQSQFIV
jgi:Kef-type K+ transport system membrane component KefB